MKNNFLLMFVAVLLLGAFLRFYQLGAIPHSLEWDEVSIGYNAYSILQTGKDEYGESFPTAFRAFGEYKQPVYVYLDAAAISAFGMNAFAVRFPSALFGTLTILFVYLLVFELFKKYPFARTISFLSMLAFAVSPWSIQFSRGAFEANVSLCFVIAGVWLFLRGLSLKKNWYFFVSVLLFVVSTYTYISQKVIIPFLFLALLIYGFRFFKTRKVLAAILIVFFAVGSFLWILDTRSVSRGQGVLFTNQKTELLAPSLKDLHYDNEQNDALGGLVHNRRIVYAQSFTQNYLSHFDPVWLFMTGDAVNRHHAPGMGVLYLVSLPLILLGIFFLVTRALPVAWILFVWLLVAPLASALTFEAPHALRSLIFLPTWQIFEAAGLVFLFQKFAKGKWAPVLPIVLAVLFALNIFYYFHQYFVHTNTAFQKDWQFGYKEAILYASANAKDDARIVFSKNLEQPYIFYLYHTQHNPKEYVAVKGSWRTSEACYTIHKAYFGTCIDKLRSGDLYIAAEDESLQNAKELKRFNYTDGKPATTVYQYE